MASLSRLLHPRPVLGCRSYSSFFSKPGGGRYFTSAKPPKSVVTASAKKSSREANSASEMAQNNKKEDSSAVVDVQLQPSAVSQTVETDGLRAPTSSSRMEPGNVGRSGDAALGEASKPRASGSLVHPILDEREFKLHQFFALHRPLLHLHDPQSLFRSSPPGPIDLLTPPSVRQTSTTPGLVPGSSLAEMAETPSEADAETARQISRALAINRIGSVVDWENTLRRLGYNVDLEPGRMSVKEQLASESEVALDSTKRKRRKKMKKHK